MTSTGVAPIARTSSTKRGMFMSVVSVSRSDLPAAWPSTAASTPRNLTSGRRVKRLHQYPACGGRGSGRRDHS